MFMTLFGILIISHNKKGVDIRILENGYFKDNIKSIILGIKSLQEFGILENNLNLYLDSDISVVNVVNVIKEL